MRFVFDETKATQAAAFLLKKAGGQDYLLKLMKLLYLADRQALVEGGLTITGDSLVSMPKGPVLSGVLDLVNYGSPPDHDSPWCNAIAELGPGRILKVEVDPGDDDLSEFETSILSNVYSQYGHIDRWDLVDLLHKTLPEFKDPGNSSCPIEPADILRYAGFSDADIRGMVEDAEGHRAMKVAIESR